jgi:hypothetical protein
MDFIAVNMQKTGASGEQIFKSAVGVQASACP